MSLSLDTSHSSVEFAVRHMGIATVRGRFEKFTVQAEVDDNGQPTYVSAEIDAASINTGNKDRDAHLRSADFFTTDEFPVIKFESTSIVKRGDQVVFEGGLTIKGITKPATFQAEVSDFVKDPWGNQRLMAEASGKINRTDWGLTWNQILEAGSLLVSEDVRFTMNIQLVAQAEVAA
ncbi:MAG TPA: YceI family protein [Trueperaceae bacterium]|nr:YceI family protein [Trueperaceae bacterium]